MLSICVMSCMLSLRLWDCRAWSAVLESVCITTGPLFVSCVVACKSACRTATSSVCSVEQEFDVLQEAVKCCEYTPAPVVPEFRSTDPSV